MLHCSTPLVQEITPETRRSPRLITREGTHDMDMRITRRSSTTAAAKPVPNVTQSTLSVTFRKPSASALSSRNDRLASHSPPAGAHHEVRSSRAQKRPPSRRHESGATSPPDYQSRQQSRVASRTSTATTSKSRIPITVLNRRTRCEDRTPLPLTPTEAARLRLHPRVAGAVPWVARTLEACVRPGARGCSPRVVQACGGVRTIASLEFGRCVDAGMSFSSGVSIEMLGAVLASLSSCRDWHETRNWETVDEFRLLCRLPALGESCVVMRNTYPASRTHVNTEHYRSSIESERLLLCAQPGVGESAAHAARQAANVYAQSALLQHAADDAATPRHPHGDDGRESRQRRAHEAADAVSVSARAAAAATAPNATTGSHVPAVPGATANAAAASSGSSSRGGRGSSVGGPPGSLADRTVGDSSASAHVGVSARRARELRAAASATVTAALLARTSETAISEPGPFDVRVRVEREVPVPTSALRDLMEPARSDLQLMRTFRIGHATSVTAPAWQYEVLLVWVARGVTQAERLQREKPPRCVVRLKLLNAAELLLSGARTVTQLATSMLAKALQLQDTLYAATHRSRVSPCLSGPAALGTPRFAAGTPFTVRSGTPAAAACTPHTYAARHGSYSTCTPVQSRCTSASAAGEERAECGDRVRPASAAQEGRPGTTSGTDADTFGDKPVIVGLDLESDHASQVTPLVLPSTPLHPGETVIVASEEAYDRVPVPRKSLLRVDRSASSDLADLRCPSSKDASTSTPPSGRVPRRVGSCQAIAMSDPADLASGMTRLPPTLDLT